MMVVGAVGTLAVQGPLMRRAIARRKQTGTPSLPKGFKTG